MNGATNVKVVCRFKPPTELEMLDEQCQYIISNDGTVVGHPQRDEVFAFDSVFDGNSSQQDIFNYTSDTVVDDLLRGYNQTIFAYGQTGSGKTYTMMGNEGKERGLTPRIIEKLFSTMQESSSSLEFTVKVSFMEIYMERVRDLLNPTEINLPVNEDPKRGVFVKGLLEVFVSTISEVYEAMKRGTTLRSTSATNMNQESSRSHSIFTIQINQKNLNNLEIRNSKLCLVDLAGSEKVSKTGASGQTLEEAKKINKSLSALGMVINALTDGNSQHVPYRDSKLTRILQESIGGNSRTTLIITCNTSRDNEQETLSTLRFGVRAKKIKNHATINKEASPAELKVLLRREQVLCKKLEEKVGRLEAELLHWRAGEPVYEKDKNELEDKNHPQLQVNDDESYSNLKLNLENAVERQNQLEDLVEEKDVLIQLKCNQILKFESEIKERNEEAAKLKASIHEIQMNMEHLQYETQDANNLIDTINAKNLRQNNIISDLEGKLAEIEIERRDLYENLKNLSVENNKLSTELECLQQKPIKIDFQSQIDDDRILQIQELNEELDNTKSKLETITKENEKLRKEHANLNAVNEEIEKRINEYKEELKSLQEIEKNKIINDSEQIENVQNNLNIQFRAELDIKSSEITMLQEKVELRDMEISNLKSIVSEHLVQNEKLQCAIKSIMRTPDIQNEKIISDLKKEMAILTASYEAMQNKLNKEVQDYRENEYQLQFELKTMKNNYEKVMDLQKIEELKLIKLENSLVQLQTVHKNLVDQNSILKNDAIANELKLKSRDSRIGELESKVLDLQKRADSLVQAKSHSKEEFYLKSNEPQIWLHSPNIIKPIRGGIAAPAAETDSLRIPPKRSSWYISLLKNNK